MCADGIFILFKFLLCFHLHSSFSLYHVSRSLPWHRPSSLANVYLIDVALLVLNGISIHADGEYLRLYCSLAKDAYMVSILKISFDYNS